MTLSRDTATVADDVIDFLELQSLVLVNVPEMFKREFEKRYFEFYPAASQKQMEDSLAEACAFFKI
jgi:hypothetical protein